MCAIPKAHITYGSTPHFFQGFNVNGVYVRDAAAHLHGRHVQTERCGSADRTLDQLSGESMRWREWSHLQISAPAAPCSLRPQLVELHVSKRYATIAFKATESYICVLTPANAIGRMHPFPCGASWMLYLSILFTLPALIRPFM